MSKVSKFCLEKEYHTLISEFKYSLLSLYKYSLSLHRASAEGTFKLFFKALMVSAAVSKLGKTDQELQYREPLTVII